MSMKPSRRAFLLDSTFAAAAAAACREAIARTGPLSAAPSWPIGCFNRPWANSTFDEALDGIKEAGYRLTGLLTRTKTEPFIGSGATPDYIENLKKRIAARGLTANLGALSSRHDIPLEESIADVNKQIENAGMLGLRYVMSFGVDRPDQYEHYFRVMAAAAAYGQGKGLQVVMKPHGGSSGTSEEILRCIDKVANPNFKIWYDAGNIIHYTGKDPVAELKPVVKYVTGFCAKDCAQMKGDVMIQFGAGKVDFKGVFEGLKAGGFDGPVMVECAAPGDTAAQVTANARANREFLEKVLASL
jgi:sugar phosphate isomerase/epimerase